MLIAHVNVAKNYRGGERQTELLLEQLHRRGVGLRLIARRGSPLAERVERLGVEVRTVSGHLPGVLRATRGADLVHVHEGRSVYAAYLRHLLSGTPYIATRRVNNPIKDHGMAHRAYRAAARIVAVAPQVADVVRAFDSEVKLGVILSSSSGLTADSNQVGEIRRRIGGEFIVGHVGALDNDQKAQDVIIAAARKLASSDPNTRIVLVGGGKDEAMLRGLAQGLDNVIFTGFVDNVGDYLGAFDIFILPSRREGIGSILFDAMEHALPLIVTPVGGVPRIVFDGQNGILIDVDDAGQLADAIARLKSNPELRAKLGNAGKHMAVGHTAYNMAAAYLKVYQAILRVAS